MNSDFGYVMKCIYRNHDGLTNIPFRSVACTLIELRIISIIAAMLIQTACHLHEPRITAANGAVGTFKSAASSLSAFSDAILN